MKAASLFYALILSALSLSAFADAGKVMSGSNYVYSSDNSCSEVSGAWLDKYGGTTALYAQCDANPVVAGSAIYVHTATGTFTKYLITSSAATSSQLTNELNALLPRVGSLEDIFQSSSLSEAYDPVLAGALFSFFFSFIVGVWVFCKNIGLIINAVRRW